MPFGPHHTELKHNTQTQNQIKKNERERAAYATQMAWEVTHGGSGIVARWWRRHFGGHVGNGMGGRHDTSSFKDTVCEQLIGGLVTKCL